MLLCPLPLYVKYHITRAQPFVTVSNLSFLLQEQRKYKSNESIFKDFVVETKEFHSFLLFMSNLVVGREMFNKIKLYRMNQ